jgi:hypothetical protein
LHVIGHIESVHPINTDQQDMFNPMVTVGLGVRESGEYGYSQGD